MTAVDLHRDLGEAGLRGHLLIHQPRRYERHDLALPRADPVEEGAGIGDHFSLS